MEVLIYSGSNFFASAWLHDNFILGQNRIFRSSDAKTQPRLNTVHVIPLEVEPMIFWLLVQMWTMIQWNPAYGHLGNMVSLLLLPLFLGHLAKTAIHFLVKKTSLIWPNFFVPLVTVLMEFHCIIKKLFAKQNKPTQLLKELKMWQQPFSTKAIVLHYFWNFLKNLAA